MCNENVVYTESPQPILSDGPTTHVENSLEEEEEERKRRGEEEKEEEERQKQQK